MIYYFEFEPDKMQASEHELAHALLRLALKEKGIENAVILKEASGKPFIAGSEVYFNLTHTEGFCAAALMGSPVGIDAEKTDRSISARMIERISDEEERSLFSPIELFTMKEAASKLTGKGIGEILQGIKLLSCGKTQTGICLVSRQIGGYTLSAASEKEHCFTLKRVSFNELKHFLKKEEEL